MKNGKILIIDDDADLLAAYKRVLERVGYEIHTAGDGAEGLARFRSVQPDLIFLDSVLPDIEGEEICHQIKAEQGPRSVFVVMVSGRQTSPDYQARVLENGADGFLQKPIDRKVLLASAQAMFRLKKAEEELNESKEQYRDLAEKLQATNQRLEEYNRLKAEFIANMSHELRTPLTAIIGFAQLAQMRSPERPLSPDSEHAFKRILLNGKHLLALIDEVLDIAKIEAGRIKLHPDHFDLTDLVQDAFNELQSLAIQKDLDYNLSVSDELPFAFTDPVRIRQVIINLLSNAIKFTKTGGVRATLSLAGPESFRFTVRDTGIGIDGEAIKFIFERFRQVDGAMTRVAGGTGLGLSIVKQIVELLGGEIKVSSEPGNGSEFIVTLPLELPADRQAAVRAEAETEAAQSNEEGLFLNRLGETEEDELKPLVLIIEDDADMANLLSESVRNAGYRTKISRNGKDGLSLAREQEVSAILLDVMMPGMDGWKVLQALKADQRTLQIPVIVCSIVDNRPLGYRLGASHYFVKPVEPQRLTGVLSDIIPTASKTEENYVLVVDDEHGVRELLTAGLKRAGFNPRAAASGEIALKLISKSVPQAVLCDLMMPGGMSGYELIARIRSNPQTESLPIIVITGKDMTLDDKHFISNEIAEVIRKGDLMMSDLETRLRQTLEEIGVNPINGKNIDN